MTTVTLDWVLLSTPVGPAYALIGGGAVRALGFQGTWKDSAARATATFGEESARQGESPGLARTLERYFSGEVDALAAVPVLPCGTQFQKRVWAAIREIPAGETRTYGELAATLGVPNAARAVGAANGQNPVALIIPCHRLVESTGTLTGYAWGLERKRRLLEHEAAAMKKRRADDRRGEGAPATFAHREGGGSC